MVRISAPFISPAHLMFFHPCYSCGQNGQHTCSRTYGHWVAHSFARVRGRLCPIHAWYSPSMLGTPLHAWYSPSTGTPIFKLLSGRSACPHEYGTVSREAYALQFDGGFRSTTLSIAEDADEAMIMFTLATTSITRETAVTVMRLEHKNVVAGQVPLQVWVNNWDITANGLRVANVDPDMPRPYVLKVARSMLPSPSSAGFRDEEYTEFHLEVWSLCEYNLFVENPGANMALIGADDGCPLEQEKFSPSEFRAMCTRDVDHVDTSIVFRVTIAAKTTPAVAPDLTRIRRLEPGQVGPGRVSKRSLDDPSSAARVAGPSSAARDAADGPGPPGAMTSSGVFEQRAILATNIMLLTAVVGLFVYARRNRRPAVASRPRTRQTRPRMVTSILVLGLLSLARCASVLAVSCPNVHNIYNCGGLGVLTIASLDIDAAVTNLDVSKNSIATLFDTDLASFSFLQVLNLGENPLETVEAGAFAGNGNLETVMLAGVPLQMLPEMLLTATPKLQSFDASESSLGHAWLATGPFGGLDELHTVRFSNVDPPLLGINRAMFSDASLRTLDLSHNNIAVVAESTFAGMLSTDVSVGSDRQLFMDENPSICEINDITLEVSCTCADNTAGSACGGGASCNSDSANFELPSSAVGSRRCSGQHCWTPVEPVAGSWCTGATQNDLDTCRLECPAAAQAGSPDVADGTYAPHKAGGYAICVDGAFRPLDDSGLFPYCDYVYASCDAIPPPALPNVGSSRTCAYSTGPWGTMDCPGPVPPEAGMYNNSCAPSADVEICELECPSEPPNQPSGAFYGRLVPTTFGVAQCMDGQWRSPDYAAPVNSWGGKLPHCEYEYASCADAPPSAVPDAGTPRQCEICSSRNQQPVRAITFRWVTSSSDPAVVWFYADRDHSYSETAEPGGTVTVESVSVNNDQAFSSSIDVYVAGSPQRHVVQASCEDTPSSSFGPSRQGLMAIGDAFGFENGSLVIVGFETSAGRNQASCAAAAAPEPGEFDPSCTNVRDLDFCSLECPLRPGDAEAIYHGQFQSTGYGLGACVDGAWKTLDYMAPEPQFDGYGGPVSLWDAKLPHCEYVYASCDQAPPAPYGVPAYVAAPPCEICGPYHALHPDIERITSLTVRWDLHSPSSGNTIEILSAANSGIWAYAPVNLAHGEEMTLAVTAGAPLPMPMCDVFYYSGSKAMPRTLVFRLVGGGTDCTGHGRSPGHTHGRSPGHTHSMAPNWAPTMGGADCPNPQSGYASVTGSPLSAGPIGSVSCGSISDLMASLGFNTGQGNDESFQGDMLTIHNVRTSTICTVSDSSGGQQTISIHTSGAEPLALGDRFGGLELVGFTNGDGTSSEFCPHPAIRATNRATGQVADLDTSCWTTMAIGDGLHFNDGDLTIIGFNMSSGRSERECPAHSAAFYPAECAGSEDGSLCALQCPEYAGEYNSSVASGSFVLTSATSDLNLKQCWDGEWDYAFQGTVASRGFDSWPLSSSAGTRSKSSADLSNPAADDNIVVRGGDDGTSFCEFAGVSHALDHTSSTMAPTISPPTNAKQKAPKTNAGSTKKKKHRKMALDTGTPKSAQVTDGDSSTGTKGASGSSSHFVSIGVGVGVTILAFAIGLTWWMCRDRVDTAAVTKSDSEHYVTTAVDRQKKNADYATTPEICDATIASTDDLIWDD